MYSPKINESFVVLLWHLKQKTNKPITKLANEAVKEYLEKHKSLITEEVENERPVIHRRAS